MGVRASEAKRFPPFEEIALVMPQGKLPHKR
jgi:hypothetical protein